MCLKCLMADILYCVIYFAYLQPDGPTDTVSVVCVCVCVCLSLSLSLCVCVCVHAQRVCSVHAVCVCVRARARVCVCVCGGRAHGTGASLHISQRENSIFRPPIKCIQFEFTIRCSLCQCLISPC